MSIYTFQINKIYTKIPDGYDGYDGYEYYQDGYYYLFDGYNTTTYQNEQHYSNNFFDKRIVKDAYDYIERTLPPIQNLLIEEIENDGYMPENLKEKKINSYLRRIDRIDYFQNLLQAIKEI